MDPCPPGCVRVTIACRLCGHTDTLDLQHASPERLRSLWPRCSECLSSDIAIEVTDGPRGKPLAGGGEGS
jgi:hypothetical protein